MAKCILCSADEIKRVSRLVSRHAPGLVRAVGVCGVCGHVQISPPYPDAEIAQINKAFLGEKYAASVERAEIDEAKRRRVNEHLEGLLRSDIRVLDVGGGTGWAFDLARSHGASFHFVEPLESLGRELERRGATWVARSWDDSELANSVAYDVVLLRHVLEHLPDPEAVVRRIAELTAPGGHAYIAVPNGAANDLDRKGFRTSFLRPTHLSYFHPRTLHGLVARARLQPVREFIGAEIALVLRREAGDVAARPQPSLENVCTEQYDRYRRIRRRSLRSDLPQAMHETASYLRRRLAPR